MADSATQTPTLDPKALCPNKSEGKLLRIGRPNVVWNLQIDHKHISNSDMADGEFSLRIH